MSRVKCSYCFSTRVALVESYSGRDVAVIRCANCGKSSLIDMESTDVDPETLSDTTHPPQSS